MIGLMIITRTPFRISFFGGGTDYPAWYKENRGAVVASSINKYCYISCRYLPPFFEHKSRIVYSKMEQVNDLSEIDHPSVRECLKHLNIKDGIEIHHDADLPARAGMGSSSAFTVGLLNALYALQGKMKTKMQLCLEAIHVEQDLIRENVGSQDQTIVAHGGFNHIKFQGENDIQVCPLTLGRTRLEELQSHLLIFFTGFSRVASDVAKEQIKNIPQKKRELQIMLQIVDEALKILVNESDIEGFGKLLHESWDLKKKLSCQITNNVIDEIYDVARKAGAVGGKLLGAGGGGFLLFFAKPQYHGEIKKKLSSFLHVPIEFENSGSQVIFYGSCD